MLNPFIYEGQVVKVDDPDQMGRVKIWIPAIDGENFDIAQLPWAEYASPLAGFTVDYPTGEAGQNESQSAYGWWAIPKLSATVLCFFLAGDSSRRFYFASTIRLHRNRSLPAGRNMDPNGQPGPWGDASPTPDGKTYQKIEPSYSNLREQFQNKMTESEAITRGLYERQVAQAAFQKDGKEGYSKTPEAGENYLDPQTYCFVTPGRHMIIFQDDPKFGRVRIRSANGHQVLLDDANERIYISTCKGKSYAEMDVDGHIHFRSAASFSVSADEDINFSAGRKINLSAGKGINMMTDGDFKLSAEKSIHLHAKESGYVTICGSMNMTSETDMKITSQKYLDISTAREVRISGSRIDLNGPKAKTADCAKPAEKPTIVPEHEPWKRPATKGKRGTNWKA